MINVLVTGSNGQLGSELRMISGDYPELNFHFTDVDNLDLTEYNNVSAFFTKNEIDVCINCAAYTAVDNAEDDRELAMLLNNEMVGKLSEICMINSALLVHISTDYVFSGMHYKPYIESDPIAPNSYYGSTKAKGEEAALGNCDKVVIIRTAWLYSSSGNNFVKTMLRLGSERDELGVVADQVGTPTYAADLAKAILQIVLQNGKNNIKEIYHFSNEGAISWYDFAKAIMAVGKINCNVVPIESKDFPAKANRPYYSVLSKEKIKSDFNVKVPYWLDSLRDMIDKKNKY